MKKRNAIPKLAVCYRTDRGMVRRNNQDSIFCYIGTIVSVFCVADGMGGHADGEIASGEVVRTIKEWVQKLTLTSEYEGISQIANDFETCLTMANDRIYHRYSGKTACGTTMVALLIWKNQYAVFSVGDSRVYQRQRFSFRQMTRDDVWQNQPEIIGMGISDFELEKHPEYGKLTKAIGGQAHVVPSRITGVLKRKDMFLLCSDGIYKACKEADLKKSCGGFFFATPERKLARRVDRICAIVDQKGAKDNYSLVIVKIL